MAEKLSDVWLRSMIKDKPDATFKLIIKYEKQIFESDKLINEFSQLKFLGSQLMDEIVNRSKSYILKYKKE